MATSKPVKFLQKCEINEWIIHEKTHKFYKFFTKNHQLQNNAVSIVNKTQKIPQEKTVHAL